MSFAEPGFCLPKFFGKLAVMTTEGQGRLAAAVRQCRDDNDWTQEDVAERAGLSVLKVRDIEKARGPVPRASTLKKLDKGLGWVERSASSVMKDGAVPRALPRAGSAQDAAVGYRVTLSAEGRDRLLGALRDIRESADEALKVLGS